MSFLRTKAFIDLNPLDQEQLEILMDDVDYNYYFPKDLYRDLTNLVVWQRYSIKSHAFIAFDEITNFLNLIPNSLFSLYNAYTPYKSAMLILKELSKTISFKKLELENTLVYLNKTDHGDNYVLELDKDEEKFLIDSNVEDISKVVKLSYNTLEGYTNKDKFVDKMKNINSMSEFIKSKKSELKKPLFLLNLIKHSLRITKEEIEFNKDKDIVFIEDRSTSMKKSNVYSLIKALQLFLLKEDINVYYVQLVGDEFKSVYLENKEQKIKQFSNNDYYNNNCNYKSLFSFINDNFKNKQVLLVTDGEDFVDVNGKFDFILNCINTKSRNQALKNICKMTKGNYTFIN